MSQTFTPPIGQVIAAYESLGLNRAERFAMVARMVNAGTARAPFETCCASLDRFVVRLAARKPFGRKGAV